MSPKQKRRRTKKPNKVVNYWWRRQWHDDLPEYLSNLICRNPLGTVSGGIWKSLRAPESCFYNNNGIKHLPYLVELPDFRRWNLSHVHCVDELSNSHFWNSSDVVIMEPDSPSGFYPATCAVYAPSFRSKWQKTFVFTGISHPAFLFSATELYQHSSEWVKKNCNIVDPNAPIASHENPAYLQFTSAIAFKGKVYALSLYGTITVIEVTDSSPSITYLGKSRAFPSIPLKHFKEYLLRSAEEIFLVFLVSKRSMNIVDGVEIFRLNCDTLSLDKVHSLGDRTVIVGAHCGIVASSVEARCRRNCVYFHHRGSNDTWRMFDMETHQISCLENIEDG